MMMFITKDEDDDDDFEYTEEELLALYTGELPKECRQVVIEMNFKSLKHLRNSEKQLKLLVDNFFKECMKLEGFINAEADIGMNEKWALEHKLSEGYKRIQQKANSGEATKRIHRKKEDDAYQMWDLWPNKEARGERTKFIEAAITAFRVEERTVERWLTKWKNRQG